MWGDGDGERPALWMEAGEGGWQGATVGQQAESSGECKGLVDRRSGSDGWSREGKSNKSLKPTPERPAESRTWETKKPPQLDWFGGAA